VRGWEVAVADPVGEVSDLAGLSSAAERLDWAAPRDEGPPFTDGLVGVVTDDVSAALLGLDDGEDPRPSPAPLPPVWFGEYAGAGLCDPAGRWWVAGRTTGDADRAEALIRAGATRAGSRGRVVAGHTDARMTADAGGASAQVSTTPRDGRGPSATDDLTAAWTSIDRAAHARAVGRIKSWIADGDVYQVNLTLHVRAPWTRSPRALAGRLFGASHGAAHAAFLHAPGATIASISPETFLRTDGRQALVRPIKGTRRRLSDPVADAALATDLQQAVKDAAEHVMIVDLERNDLGRISQVGTVRVPELMTLEAHPTVWHLTSTVEGRVRDDIGFDGLLSALFPCGSVTGAPKRMAVDRTRLVEPWRRGAYCGAIGVVGRGVVDLSVAIRTAVVHDGMAWYGAGGGIVSDSDADAEWDEVMAKAAAFLTATGTTAPG
jgi:para-aminobenzoate synthetase component I